MDEQRTQDVRCGQGALRVAGQHVEQAASAGRVVDRKRLRVRLHGAPEPLEQRGAAFQAGHRIGLADSETARQFVGGQSDEFFRVRAQWIVRVGRKQAGLEHA